MAELLWKHLDTIRETSLFLDRPGHLLPGDVFADQEVKNTQVFTDALEHPKSWAEILVRENLKRSPKYFQFDLPLWVRFLSVAPADLRQESVREDRRRKATTKLNQVGFETFDQVVHALHVDSPLVHFQTVVAIAAVDRGQALNIAAKLVATCQEIPPVTEGRRQTHPALRALLELSRQTQQWGALKYLWQSAVNQNLHTSIRETIANGFWTAPYAVTIRAQRHLIDLLASRLTTLIEQDKSTTTNLASQLGPQHQTDIAHILHPLHLTRSPASVEVTANSRPIFEAVAEILSFNLQAGNRQATYGALAGTERILRRPNRQPVEKHHVQSN